MTRQYRALILTRRLIMNSTILSKRKRTTRTTLIITMTKQMLSTLRGTRFYQKLYLILFLSSGESVDYSNIIQTIVADAADDITEEPAANQESGIELDELIDRRKVFGFIIYKLQTGCRLSCTKKSTAKWSAMKSKSPKSLQKDGLFSLAVLVSFSL